MFGGINEITKEKNDISVYLINKKKWVKVHHETNDIYEASPTIKKQMEDSPNVIESKRKKNQYKAPKTLSGFKLDLKSATVGNSMTRTNKGKSFNFGKT